MRRTPQRGQQQYHITTCIRENRLNWLLLFIPVSGYLALTRSPAMWVFVTAALALVPLAGLIGKATEEVADYLGPHAGGLLNATFGNATELIIALFALHAGLLEVVKASISGSIISNILLVLGLSMLVGGWGREKQTFNRTSAGASAAMLFLAVVALVLPAVFDLTVTGSLRVTNSPTIREFSLLVAAVLLLTYLASLLFSLKTHRSLFVVDLPDASNIPRLSVQQALLILLLATVLTALEAELLVGAIKIAAQDAGDDGVLRGGHRHRHHWQCG